MDFIFLAIGLFFTLVTIITMIIALITFRKERRVSALATLVSIFLAFLMVPIYVFFGSRVNLLLALPVMAVGFLIGLVWGLTTRLYRKDRCVVGKHSLLALAGWGGAWVLSQLLNLFGSALLTALGLLPVFFMTGTQMGRDSNMLLRLLVMRPPPVPVAPTQVPGGSKTVPPPTLPEREVRRHGSAERMPPRDDA